MTTNVNKKNTTAISIGIMLLVLFACLGGLPLVLIYFNAMYVANVIATIIALTTAFALLLQQKRISGYAITAFIISILFFTSSVSQFLHDNAIAPLPVLEQVALLRVVQPEKISRGLLYLGMGIALAVGFFGKFKSVKFKQITATQFTELSWFTIGIFFIFVGVYYTFNGLHGL